MNIICIAVLIICLLIFVIGIFIIYIDIQKELIKERYSEDIKKLEDLSIKVKELRELREKLREVENSIAKMTYQTIIKKNDEYYNGLLEWEINNREE